MFALAALAVLLPGAEVGGTGDPAGGDVPGRVAAAVDRHLAAGWADAGVSPAGPATDAVWLRRVHLDLTGRLPAASAVRDFLNHQPGDAGARAGVVDGLLDGPGYVTHFTAVWRDALAPELARDPDAAFLRPGFEAWLRHCLLTDVPYNKLVRELLTADLAPAGDMSGPAANAAGPRAFYQAKNVAPEELAAAVTRSLLGTRLECAECHDHPFDHWRQDQFWRFAAFFSGLERAGTRRLGALRERTGAAVLKIPDAVTLPGGVRKVSAAYLDDAEPALAPGDTPRAALADRLTARDNTLFAEVAVNRLFAEVFGRGLVSPVDDWGAANPPSHPQLLTELAGLFVESGYDPKAVLAGLCRSDAYALSSKHPGDPPARLFARYAVEPLPAPALYDALEAATGGFTPFGAESPRLPGMTDDGGRAEFLRTFRDDAESPADRRTSILQALALMNGDLVAGAADLGRSRTLAAVAGAPFLDRGERLDALYLATVSRFPTAREREDLTAYLHAAESESAGLADIFWALLNGSEFATNH